MKKLFTIILTLLMSISVNSVFATNKYNETSTPSSGNVFIIVKGKYISPSKDTILKRINAIRYEACKNGYINPNTGKKLTTNDYIAIKWSSDLEYIARLRACEGTVVLDHTRPNGQSCFSANHNGVYSWGENLAWNYSGLMEGIEQWYSEKSDYVNKTGEVTGHYTSMINPNNKYIGVGTFEDTVNGGWLATCAEFSDESDLDETKLPLNENVNQYVEIQYDSIKNYIKLNNSYTLDKSSSKQLNLTVNGYYNIPNEYVTWKSSNTNIVAISNGKITAINYGITKVTAAYQGKTYSTTINVKKNISNTKISSISNKTYNGKQQKPKVTVKDGNTTLTLNKDYKVSYGSNKNVGKGNVTITGIGNYTGSKKITFKINPKGTSLSKLSSKSKKLSVKWKRNKQVNGYQIQYSTSSKMKNAKTINIKSNKTTSKTISNLSKKKKYYVRIRTYKNISKTKYYSSWSKVKSVKTK